MKSTNFLSLMLITLLPACAVSSQQVKEYQLDNGMKILVRPDHRAPVVISQIWYKVGSSNEHSGITGLSHVLEHMMFKGTEKVPSGRFSAIINENGGEQNAFTSRDYTAYYQYLGKDRLEIAFELEADRMRNVIFDPESAKKEIEVVKEERFMRTDDKPEALTYERFNAVAYLNSPYHHPVIGWEEDLNTMTVPDLKAWYNTWYQPNNATLVVVGDVKPNAVHALAKKYFAKIKPAEIPPAKLRKETHQHGERRIKVKAPAKIPYILIGYAVPVLNTAEKEWEPYALDVLAGILDGGSSSRLSKNMIRKQEVAASVGAGYSLTGKHQSLFLLDGNPASGHTLEEVEKGLYEQIEKLQQELVSKGELERVKAQVIAGEVFQRDSISHMANQMGMLETVGLGWKLVDDYANKIRAVTPEQIKEVAEKYLIEKHRTVAQLIPEAISDDHDKESEPTS